MAYEIDTTVLGGLPVTVEFDVYPAEPDVGIFSAYVENVTITHVAGKRKKNTDWIEARMTSREHDALTEECNEAAGGW